MTVDDYKHTFERSHNILLDFREEFLGEDRDIEILEPRADMTELIIHTTGSVLEGDMILLEGEEGYKLYELEKSELDSEDHTKWNALGMSRRPDQVVREVRRKLKEILG